MADYQGEKFKTFLVKNKIRKVDAAKRLGIVRSALYDYFISQNMSRETVQKILDTFNVEEREIWEITDTPTTHSEKDSVDVSIAKEMSNARPVDIAFGPANMYVVPVKAYGGFLSGYENSVFLDSLQKAPFPFVKGECFAFEVDGLSMYKDYLPGDWVVATLVENLEWLSKGKVYVFQTVDGIIIKCFEKIEGDYIYLKSLNEEYNPVSPIHLKDLKKVYFKEKVIKN